MLLSVSTLLSLYKLKLERLFMHFGLQFSVDAEILPDRNKGKFLVVSKSFPLFRLILIPQMTSAGLLTLKRIHRHQFCQFKVIGHPVGKFQIFVIVIFLAWYSYIFPELLSKGTNFTYC